MNTEDCTFFCTCDDCSIERVERIEALTSYVISLEGTITVAQLLLADGKIEAARELIAFAAIRARECDITGEVHAERQMREAHTVAKLREAGRLH